MLRCALLIVAGLAPALACAHFVHAASGPHAIWVTRFDYRTADDVRAVVANAASGGFDTLVFQVRGNATVFYPSEIEPWAEHLEWKDPGFDPLRLALDLAHEQQLRVQAWVNVVPAWWGPTPPPKDSGHLYHTRPEWFWYDQYGRRQALSERFYVSLNPCREDVRAYLADVIAELVERYPDLDGLHLDYIRFPNEPPATPAESDVDYPRDPHTVALFREAHGKRPDDAPAAWSAWRTDAITSLLRGIRARVRTIRPGLPISAAVGPDVARAREHHFQDVDAWVAEGLVDQFFPMNYTADGPLFERRLERWRHIDSEVPVVPGVMLASGDLQVRRSQLHSAQNAFGGFCVFAYSALYDSPNQDIDSQDAPARAARATRRAFFEPILRELAE